MARRWLGTGVLDDYLNELAVTADGSAMSVSVATGGAWIEGFYFESDAAAAQTIEAADATNGRIDYVVVELDRTTNTCAFKVVKGTAAASPVAPTLTQTDTQWQMPLATVTVDAAVGVIAADKVTDQRTMSSQGVSLHGGDTITASAASVIPLVVKGAASQTANLLEARQADGTVRARVSSDGGLYASGGASLGYTLFVQSPVAAANPLVVRGATNQTTNLSEWQDSAGTVLARIGSSGFLDVPGNTVAVGPGAIGIANTTLRVGSLSASDIGLVVRGAASQTANLAEFQNSAGTVVFAVRPDGNPIIGANNFLHGGAAGADAGYFIVEIPGQGLRRVAYGSVA